MADEENGGIEEDIMTTRGKRYLSVFSLYTAVNVFLLTKLHVNGDLRTDYTQNYMKQFHVWDILLFGMLFGIAWAGGYIIYKKIFPYVVRHFAIWEEKRPQAAGDKWVKWKIFGCIWGVWFFFFLVMYPGTAMNDTIYILEEPWLSGRQHPIVYNLYTYGIFRLGNFLWNENLGLALISLIQMTAMSHVISTAIALMYQEGAKKWLCGIFTAYFSWVPLFSTYAVSAIKDTPFSIFLFYLLILLWQAYDSQGDEWDNRRFCIKMGVCLWGMICFRSNGLFIAVGTVALLLMVYKKWRKKILILALFTMIFSEGMVQILQPAGQEKLFQEGVGMQLQQTAAVINKGQALTTEQEKYLYRLFPEELWNNYAPCCVDVIKWHEEFDREFLNENKWEFIKIWMDLLVKNPVVYAEAHILSTYGVWGIETRNAEQYYFKDIYDNNLNLYQNSPLPEGIRNLVYKYFCNRLTYRYLSAGTAFWILFTEVLCLIYHRRYRMAVVSGPVGMLFLSLLMASPIAFGFRYVFVLALIFPFCVVYPFSRVGLYVDTRHKDIQFLAIAPQHIS